MNHDRVSRSARVADSLYRGKVVAVILDWAGTTIDFGSCAPASVFVEIFRRRGIDVIPEQARGPMGMAKREHIATLVRMEEIACQWKSRFGRFADDHDVESMYQQFLPLQKETLRAHGDLIPGTVDAVSACRKLGIKIGSTTGYTAELMEVVSQAAREQGYEPDTVVCSDDVTEGRPAPWMCMIAAMRLRVYPPPALVVVDDTTVGIQAGRHAGTWTVGVTATGNLIGLTKAEYELLDPSQRKQKLELASEKLIAAGTHYVCDSIADLPEIVVDINQRLLNGEHP
jgi:phosphonoacetaldehyde hydrolase